jgi:CRISPR-associated endonuclease/helicase Cas3
MKNILTLDENIKGKSNGITLYHHTQHLFDELYKILGVNIFILEKYKKFFDLKDEQISNHFTYTLSLHDLGKKHLKWQTHCKNNNLISVELRHEYIYTFEIIEKITKDCIEPKREHLKIGDYIKDFEKIYFIISAILSHHSNFSEKKKEKVNKTFDYLNPKYKNILSKENKSFFDFIKILFESIDANGVNYHVIWYKQAFYRYLLQLSDKRASILESNPNDNLPTFKTFNFDKNKYSKLRYLQEVVKNSDGLITVLRATTGGGKSLASVIWANEQISKGFADRMVIAMPTQFTSNALSNSISNYVGDVNVQHGNSKYFYNDVNLYKWVRTLQSSATVCTIDSLLIAMTLSNEENQHTLFNLVNSCLVIDEADFYDNFVQSNMLELLNFLVKLKVPILIMSATLPDKFIDLIKENIEDKSVTSDLKIINGTKKEECERIRVNIKNITKKFNYKKIKNKKTCIIYCNTINRAIETYHELVNIGIDEKRIILYHSQLIGEDKLKIEKSILEKLGEKAWLDNNADGFVIMTQIGELSINISSDYMVSDICPIDRLVQRFGRGCRFDFLENKICEVDIIIPQKDAKLYPAPYGKYLNKDGWEANEFFYKTYKIIKKGEYNYDDFLRIINDVYSEMKIDDKSKSNSDLLYNMNKKNIFFNSGEKIEEDCDGNQVEWKTRDINPQVKVYVGVPNEYKNFDEYKLDFNNNSLSLSYYKFLQMKKKDMLFMHNITIKDEIITVYCMNTIYYNSKFGIVEKLNNESNFI